MQALCERFNASDSVFLFLISTSAGGLGLNLTGANKYAFDLLSYGCVTCDAARRDAVCPLRTCQLGTSAVTCTFNKVRFG